MYQTTSLLLLFTVFVYAGTVYAQPFGAGASAEAIQYIDALNGYDGGEGRVNKDEYMQAKDDFTSSLGGYRSEYNRVKTSWATKQVNAQAFEQARDERYSIDCHLRNADTNIISGFGAPYNLYKPSQELLVRIKCDMKTSDYTVEVGNGRSSEYIYRYGYFYDSTTNSWQSFGLGTINGQIDGDWFVGEAFADLEGNASTAGALSQVLIYMCTYQNGSWTCGCNDQACQNPGWQLQTGDSLKSLIENNGTAGAGFRAISGFGEGDIPAPGE